MAKISKTSGSKGSTPAKTPTATKKSKTAIAVEAAAPRPAGMAVTATAGVTAANPTKAARTSAAPAPEVPQITPTMISSEERHRLIAEAAYLLAEKRGFHGGNPEQDWYDAAAQIDQMIMGMNKGRGT